MVSDFCIGGGEEPTWLLVVALVRSEEQYEDYFCGEYFC